MFYLQVHTVDKSIDKQCLHQSSLLPSADVMPKALWEIANIGTDRTKSELFYVKEIMPPVCISDRNLGRNLRRLSSIPGRESSFVQKVTSAENCTLL